MSRSVASLLALALLVCEARAATVKYLDRATGKEVELKDVPVDEDGPRGITVKPRGMKPVAVSALDVREFAYGAGEVQPIDYLTYRQPFAKLDRADQPDTRDEQKTELYRQALADIDALLKRKEFADRAAPAQIKKVKRQVQFRAAETRYRLAQLDPARRDDAARALAQFKDEHADGWQVGPALMMLAGVQEDKGDLAAVLKTFDELAAVTGISADIRTTARLSAARTLLKTDKFAEAEKRLNELQKALPADGTDAARVKVYLAQCQVLGGDTAKSAQAEKQLRQLLAAAADPSLKALAHNTLGDYYLKKGRAEDAFWEFLRVDVLYVADRYEHARALYHLARLFREVRRDAVRADGVLERLTSDKRFDGLEYQKKALQK